MASSSFVSRTFALLSDPSYQDTVAWSEDGRSFLIKDVREFTATVLPRVFKHSHFASFVRQLNVYDFHKESGTFAFSHPLFVQGVKANIRKMKRKDVPATEEKSSNAELQGILQHIQVLQSNLTKLETHLSSLQDSSAALQQEKEVIQSEIGQFKANCSRVDLALAHFSDFTEQISAFSTDRTEDSYEESLKAET